MEFRVQGECRGRQTRGLATYASCGPLFTYRDKTDFEHLFPDNALFHNIKSMETALQKNLGETYDSNKAEDSVFQSKIFNSHTTEVETKADTNTPKSQSTSEGGWRSDMFANFFGITNVITGFFNHIAGVITVQPTRPAAQEEDISKSFPPTRQESEQKDSGFEDCARDETDASPPIYSELRHFLPRDCSKNSTEVNGNRVSGGGAQCEARGAAAGPPARAAMPLPALRDPAETCRAKVATIQHLLAGAAPGPRARRPPNKIFIHPKFVQEQTVDAFAPEPLGRLESVDTTDFVNLGLIARSELAPVETLPRVKLEAEEKNFETPADPSPPTEDSQSFKETVCDSAEAVLKVRDDSHSSDDSCVEDEVKDKSGIVNKTETRQENKRGADDTKVADEIASDLERCMEATSREPENKQLVLSCEDKLNKLKALLSDRKKSKREAVCRSAQHHATVADHCHALPDEEISHENLTHSPEHDEVTTNSLFTELLNKSGSQNKISSNQIENENCIDSFPAPIHHRNSLNVEKKQKTLPKHNDQFEKLECDVSSAENSPKIKVTPPKNVKGCDESFVIVLTDRPGESPPPARSRIPSDASDDSFIVFEDDADLCEYSSDSDSDCEWKLSRAAKLARTLPDLTDESLYRDEAGCGSAEAHACQAEPERGGVLLTEERKRTRQPLPEKRVRFSEAPPQVRVMRVWAFAARQARAGNWRQCAADAERFKRRIADVDMAISWVLKPQHRNRVKFQRFMPWWHQQRRREEEEARALEERRREAERGRLAEERRIEEEVRRELEYEKKHRKKISTQQFARNFALYMMRVKQQKQSERNCRASSEKEDDKNSASRHFSDEQSDAAECSGPVKQGAQICEEQCGRV